MNTPCNRFSLPVVSLPIALVLSLVASGCASSRLATLEGVIKDGRRAAGKEVQLVQIVRADKAPRGDKAPKTKFGMALGKGDRIITTKPGVTAVISFAGGAKVILEPESELEILNPSIFVRIGRAIVTQVRRARETLEAQTEYTIAATEGTLFRVEVRGDEATYQVVEGQLLVSSRLEAGQQVVLGPLQQTIAVGRKLPATVLALDAREAREIRAVVRRAAVVLSPLLRAGLRRSTRRD